MKPPIIAPLFRYIAFVPAMLLTTYVVWILARYGFQWLGNWFGGAILTPLTAIASGLLVSLWVYPNDKKKPVLRAYLIAYSLLALLLIAGSFILYRQQKPFYPDWILTVALVWAQLYWFYRSER